MGHILQARKYFFSEKFRIALKKIIARGDLGRCYDMVLNKNYYVVGDAGFARPRNTLKIIFNFFLINQSMN